MGGLWFASIIGMLRRELVVAIAMVAGAACNAGIGDPPEPGAADAGAGGSTGADAGSDANAVCAEADMTTWYRDIDADGFGDPLASTTACEQPAGYVDNAGDCNDATSSANPLALEMCGDKIDNDCAGGDPCALSLLGHWDFSEPSGTIAGDAAGTNPGALRNGASFGGDSTVAFDGIDDLVEVSHDASYAVASGTVTVWFYTSSANLRQGLWSKDSSGLDAGGHLSIEIEEAGTIRARLQSDTDSYYVRSPAITAGAWHHVAFTFGSGGMRVYLDGVPYEANGYTGGMGANAEPTAIGALTITSDDLSVWPATFPLAGRIADVRTYDRALSATEIADAYGLTAP